tara:strand:- start:479 stop:814 length:336 start_codon:yes stop_codon:yes gene_type:complete
MNNSFYKFMDEWCNLVFPKNENLYKRELLLEKVGQKLIVPLPLSVRPIATTLATDLVPVEPLNLPTGTIFYIDYNSEREDLYNRVLLIETYKKPIRRSRRGGRGGGRKVYR